MPMAATTTGKTRLTKPAISNSKYMNKSLDTYIPIMPFMFLFIPEGVSVMTVIIDGVDVAPAGLVKRSSGFREPGVRPVDTTIHAPWMAKQPQRQTLETVRSGALQERTLRQKPPQKRGRGTFASQPDDTTGILARACVHATLRFFLPTPESGITVFTKGGALPNAH